MKKSEFLQRYRLWQPGENVLTIVEEAGVVWDPEEGEKARNLAGSGPEKGRLWPFEFEAYQQGTGGGPTVSETQIGELARRLSLHDTRITGTAAGLAGVQTAIEKQQKHHSMRLNTQARRLSEHDELLADHRNRIDVLAAAGQTMAATMERRLGESLETEKELGKLLTKHAGRLLDLEESMNRVISIGADIEARLQRAEGNIEKLEKHVRLNYPSHEP